MKEKNKKIETGSKRSYESDPALKDLIFELKDRCSHFREQEHISHSSKQLENPDFRESLNRIASTFSRVFTSIKDVERINHQVQDLIVENFFQIARALAVAVEARDPYTGGHSERVFQISMELGKRCNISKTEQLHLEGGALLHDVGKIAIRDGVLLKPGPLTDSEYKEMQLHTIIGAQIVKKLSSLQGCVDAVLFHHERMDGYGYPYGLKGNEIPMIARITSIADAYDAMTTNRIYRKALSHEYALEEIIRNSGTQFDPEIVKVFVEWWKETFYSHPEKSRTLYSI